MEQRLVQVRPHYASLARAYSAHTVIAKEDDCEATPEASVPAAAVLSYDEAMVFGYCSPVVLPRLRGGLRSVPVLQGKQASNGPSVGGPRRTLARATTSPYPSSRITELAMRVRGLLQPAQAMPVGTPIGGRVQHYQFSACQAQFAVQPAGRRKVLEEQEERPRFCAWRTSDLG